ncbi:MAG TPA: 16S rRNA (guanine(527)-N(7))-methyltransferase RsmG [Burkholderiales bacterium]|nr:16S rRNA (guanine(527)-N(7))-methyltransferase RsmG [Burkholderiales bacterium]
MSVASELQQGVSALRLKISRPQLRSLLDYLALLQKWNKVYNLTALREPQKMISHHLLDSLAVVAHIQAHHILDVGSGAGLPGIPMAIARDDWRVTLLDSSHKKAAFLKQVAIELKLANVTVCCERVETWFPEQKFELIISRAFSDLPEFVALSKHLLRQGGRFAAMKGIYPHEEIAQLPDGYHLERVIPLKIPGHKVQRHLVMVKA